MYYLLIQRSVRTERYLNQKVHCNDTKIVIIHCAVLCVSGAKLHLGTVDFCLVQNKRIIDSSVKLNNTVLEMSTIVVQREQMIYLLSALHTRIPSSRHSESEPYISTLHY